jgi:hypothetical protein
MSPSRRTPTRGEPPSSPDADEARAELLADTGLDAAHAARLRDESRRTRPRIERRLVTSGHLSPEGAPRTSCHDGHPTDDGGEDVAPVEEVDAWRDLDGLQLEHVDLLERIDAVHERRLRSPSVRERQASTRVLAEALRRIVDGYDVELVPPRGLVGAMRRADGLVGGMLGRSADVVPRPPCVLRWWARYGRWVRLALALVAGALLAIGAFTVGAVVVVARSVLSTVLFSVDLPEGRSARVLGYDPGWAASVVTHLGDAALLVGLGLGLSLVGHGLWGAVTAFVALFALLGTMLRVASGHHGFRLERLWIDRVVVTVGLAGAALGAALSGQGEPGTVGGVPLVRLAVGGIALVGLCEMVRTVYWAFCRRRLFRRYPSTGDVSVDDVMVAHTSDAVVMNIPRRGLRTRVLDEPAAGSPSLRVVGGPDR